MELFETEAIQLSMRNPETGQYLTANAYTVEGIVDEKGLPRLLSVAQLVLAICMDRAVDLENKILARMEEMAEVTQGLDALSKIEEELLKRAESSDASSKPENLVLNSLGPWTVGSTSYTTVDLLQKYLDKPGEEVVKGFMSNSSTAESDWKISASKLEDFYDAIESQMDTMNTTSQEALIELQSLTAKRDDTYNLLSNVIKSINTVNIGTANNI